MNLIRAEAKAKYLIKELEPFTDRMEIVGNIRRRKQSIDKIDLLLAPKGAMLFELMAKIVEMDSENSMRVDNNKTITLKDELESITARLWFTDLNKWAVMLLIKTGGNKGIQKIATLCKDKKWELSINNAAIFDEGGKRLPIEKEEDIFRLLGIPYIEPSWRK